MASIAQQVEDDVDNSADDPYLSALLLLSQHASSNRKCITCIVTLYRISKVSVDDFVALFLY